MNLCLPVIEDRGLDSTLSDHFSQAPLFLLVDLGNRSTRAVVNEQAETGRVRCGLPASLGGVRIEAVIVLRIGPVAASRLDTAGIPVFVTGGPTVADALGELDAQTLRLLAPADLCRPTGGGRREVL